MTFMLFELYSDNFDGIENGITVGLNIDYTDTVFKFTVLNQTGQIMSNKHTEMITEYSAYYYVSNDYLKTKRCPYPGLVEDIHIGIEDEINCSKTITITVKPAISELDIPGEITVKIDSKTQEPEILIYQLHLNATEECASYQCEIKCKNKNGQDFRISAAGSTEADKALLYVFTAPHSILYSPFKYELLFTCYDINYYFDTQTTATANFTFYDISVISSTVTTTILTFHTSGTTLSKKAMTNTETEELSSSRNLFSSNTGFVLPTLVSPTPTIVAYLMTTATNNRKTGNQLLPKTSKQNNISTINSLGVLTTSSQAYAELYWEYLTSKSSPLSSTAFEEIQHSTQFEETRTHAYATSPPTTAPLISSIGITDSNTPNIQYVITSGKNNYISTQIFQENWVKSDSELFSFTSNSGTQTISDNTADFVSYITNYSTAESMTENASISSGSFFDKHTNVIALATVAGVAAAGAVGTGAYALTSKRCNTIGYGNKQRSKVINDDNEDDTNHHP